MSCDDWDQEYHLTPRGWKTGSSKHYGRVDHEAPRPPDAVETWEQHASQTSGWSREIRMQRLIWHDPAIREERSEEHTSELQSHSDLVCRLLLAAMTTQTYTLSLHDALPICTT